MTTTEKASVWFGVRQLIYLGGCFAVVLLEHLLAYCFHGETFHEHCIIENIQLCELLLATIVFSIGKLCNGEYERLTSFFAGLCAMAVCRELDNFLGTHIPLIGWKIGVVFPIFTALYALADWQETRKELFRFLRHPAFEIMLCAMVLVFPAAQCIGHRSFLVNVLQEEHVGRIKELLEESLETIGYFILLCASVELQWKQNGQSCFSRVFRRVKAS